jgi:hypothetical protein
LAVYKSDCPSKGPFFLRWAAYDGPAEEKREGGYNTLL